MDSVVCIGPHGGAEKNFASSPLSPVVFQSPCRNEAVESQGIHPWKNKLPGEVPGLWLNPPPSPKYRWAALVSAI